MPATRWFTCWAGCAMAPKPVKGSKGYPECRRCLNAEFDPFACEDCDKGSKFEPVDDGEDAAETFSLSDFITTYREELS